MFSKPKNTSMLHQGNYEYLNANPTNKRKTAKALLGIGCLGLACLGLSQVYNTPTEHQNVPQPEELLSLADSS